MRRTLALLSFTALALVACGDGIDEGSGVGRSPRGTIDGVVLSPPSDVDGSVPPDSGPGSTDPGDTVPPGETVPPGDTVPPGAGSIEWEEVDDGLDEATLAVPLDYSHPAAGTIQLHLVRHRAVDPANRIGTLLVNPGGPGAAGTFLAESAEFIYGQDLLDRFDIVAWDPRGTGLSEPHVDCIDDYDQYFGMDSSPDTAAERQALVDAANDFAEQCRRKSGELLPFVGTQDSARDIDQIRRALGERTISYFGFSYGSELGATWATMFPDTVRAAVLDGAVDPTVGYLEQNVQQAAGFEATFDTFLAQCSASPDCAFHNDGDARGAYDALAASIDSKPLLVRPGRTRVTQGVLVQAVAVSMYDEAGWPALEQALADAADGDGAGLLDLYDSYFGIAGGSGTDDETEAYFAIGCFDDPGSSSPEELFSHLPEFEAAAPRMGPAYMAELTFCSVWPVGPAPAITITGKGAGPIVVVGTTGDPATPLQSTRNMARALEDGRLVVVSAEQHTGYGVNQCVDDAVHRYLVDPAKAPDDGLVCD